MNMSESRGLFPTQCGASLAILALSAIFGCAAINPAVPVPSKLVLPESWSTSPAPSPATDATSKTTTPLANWWTRFHDPLLVALIDEALVANTSVVSARAALAGARAQADVQAAGLLPGVGASVTAQRSRSGINASKNLNAFNAGFAASWEPDIFGGIHATVAAAKADTQASIGSLGDIQVSVAAEVAVSYMQLRGLQARLEIARNNLKNQEETLQIAQWRTQAGLATALDIEQARAAAAQTRAQIPSLQSAAAQAEHSLAVLSWRAPTALHDRLAATAAQVVTVATPNDDLVLAFPAETLRQRPDVRAAEARVIASSYRVQQSDAARYPSFKLNGSLGLRALTLGALTDGSSVLAALLGSVSGPIFDAGAGKARVRAQQAGLQQAAAAYDASILAALKDVEDSLVALRSDRDRLQNLRIAVDAAQNALLLANQRYAAGLIDFQVVLDTQRTALSTADAVASTSADINTDYVRLYKSLGGGWEASNLHPDAPAADITHRHTGPAANEQ